VKSTRSYTIKTIAGQDTVTEFGLSDTYMTLYGPNNKTKFIQNDDDSGGGGTSKIVRTLTPGDYYYKVEAFDPEATGFYFVEVD
jgi:tyrosinase